MPRVLSQLWINLRHWEFHHSQEAITGLFQGPGALQENLSLSNDMHLGFGSPGIWMQMHQVIPGKLNVTGVVVPGEPFVVAGHNENIAWGMTNLMVDDIDLFSEKR